MVFEKKSIEALDQQYRTAFINSLAGFRQAVMVGTRSGTGHSNLAIFNSLIHLGANPALFGLLSRPDVVPRDTLRNILETKEYTLNFISANCYEKAHQTSARYPMGVSEFEAVGFEEHYENRFYAPFIADAIVKIGMRFEEKIDIKINGTVMIIGTIEYVSFKDHMMSEDGFVDLTCENVLVSSGLDAYFTTRSIGRLGYAKPDKSLILNKQIP